MCCVCFFNVNVVHHSSRTCRRCCCQHDSGSIHPSLIQAFWWASNRRKRQKKGDKVSGMIDWDMPFVFCAITNVVLSHAPHRPRRWCQLCSSSPSPHRSWYLLRWAEGNAMEAARREQSWCTCLLLKTLLKDILSYTPLMLHAKTPGASESYQGYMLREAIFGTVSVYIIQYWANVYHIWFANECVAIAIENKPKSKEI
jgi:hypothetical protein